MATIRGAGVLMAGLEAAALIGIWRLVETSATDGDGNALPPPYGGTGLGTITFDGTRMVAAICQGEVAEGETREYSAYCGRYRFDGETLVTAVDATAEPSRMGSEQVRRVTAEGARIVLNPPPRPWRGLMQHRRMVWEKVI